MLPFFIDANLCSLHQPSRGTDLRYRQVRGSKGPAAKRRGITYDIAFHGHNSIHISHVPQAYATSVLFLDRAFDTSRP